MDNNLQPIFEYLDEFKGEVVARIDKLETKVDTLQTSVDNLTKVVQDFRDEHIFFAQTI